MRVLFFLFALLVGVAGGLYHLRTGHLAISALWIAGAAFLFAALRPAWGLSSAVAVALGVPVAYLGAALFGAAIPYPPSPNVAATLLAFLPALAAALFGMFLRRIIAGDSGRAVRL